MPWRQSLSAEHVERQSQQLWRTRLELESPQAVEVSRQDKHLINFCSNDYLGLANHPKMREAAINAIHTWGTGSGASHLVCGHQQSHHLLEEELARFVGAEQAILFSTGYMANLAIPQCFLRRGDLLIQDKLNHASLLDAAKLSQAEFKRYRHSDVNQVEQLLSQSQSPRKLLTTDSVFSMDGDLADLDRLNAICKKQSAVLLIDDAHGLGVLGDQGKGSYSALGMLPGAHRLMLGTLGKALGSFGAFVAGDATYIEHLKQFARTYIYTTALPPAVAETTRTALKLLVEENWRQQQLHQNIQHFRQGVRDIGLDLMESETAIQPILLGDETLALRASELLEEKGLWVSAIRPPTVPKGTARLRITLSAGHKNTHIDQLLNALKALSKEIVGAAV